MRTTRVENINNQPNQFRIWTKDGMYFQSYNSIICFIPDRRDKPILLDKDVWNYSRTTSKYRNIFLAETRTETEKKIKEGTYKLVDLN